MALRVLLIAVIIWYIIRYVIPALFGSPKKDKQKSQSGSSQSGSREFRKSTRQGDVTITDYGKRKKDVNPGDEEYTDYEEID